MDRFFSMLTIGCVDLTIIVKTPQELNFISRFPQIQVKWKHRGKLRRKGILTATALYVRQRPKRFVDREE